MCYSSTFPQSLLLVFVALLRTKTLNSALKVYPTQLFRSVYTPKKTYGLKYEKCDNIKEEPWPYFIKDKNILKSNLGTVIQCYNIGLLFLSHI